MTTATKEKNATAKGEGWQELGGNFPPLVILDINDTMQGIVNKVEIVESAEMRKGKKVGSKERAYYRVLLTQPCACQDSAKNKITFEAGKIVTLPGTGALDRSFGKYVFEKDGQDFDKYDGSMKDYPWAKLEGMEMFVQRTPDQKMKSGAFAGKPVKAYTVRIRTA